MTRAQAETATASELAAELHREKARLTGLRGAALALTRPDPFHESQVERAAARVSYLHAAYLGAFHAESYQLTLPLP